MTTERDEVREKFAAEPGKGHLVEHSLAERANLRAQGGDTARPDKVLAGLGHVPADTREQAARDRREAAKAEKAEPGAGDGEKAAESGDADPKRTPPAGRSATPPAKSTATGRGKSAT